MFALGPKHQLAQLGFFRQLDPAGRARSAPARTRLAGPHARRQRNRRIGAVLAVGATAAAVAFAWPRLFGSPPTSEVTFTSVPPGATIEIDGRAVGLAGTGGLVLRGHVGAKVGEGDAVRPELDAFRTLEAARKALVQRNANPQMVAERALLALHGALR